MFWLGIGFYVVVDRTRFGFDLRASGMNPHAARSSGVNPKAMIMKTMLISGAVAGLAGMGDLVATCISPQSRNRYVGEQLGQGRTIDEIISEMHMVAEGVKTARVVMELADEFGIDMPIGLPERGERACDLEARARAAGYTRIVLETGSRQPEAIALYSSSGYTPIASYGFYRNGPLNRCFGKDLT